jgi:5'-3' exonuclease
MLALIDGDVVTYQCGFASDQTVYTCPDGSEFQYKKEAKQRCLDKDLDDSAITKHIEPEPVEHCLHSVKIFLANVMKEIDATESKIFITGSGQDRLAMYPEYKANRDKTHKPHWYNEIHDYLVNVHNADVIIGSEADDAMAWHQMADPSTAENDQLGAETCICTIDKDLNMVPGLHYNWQRDDVYWVDPEMANRLFFEQWLSGDAADNIPGIAGIGPTKAQRILAATPDNPALLYDKVMQVWMTHKTAVSSLDYMQVHLYGDLLWMQRTPGQKWDEAFSLSFKRKENESLKHF